MRRSRVLPRTHGVQCATAGGRLRPDGVAEGTAPPTIGSAPATGTAVPGPEALRASTAPTPPNGADTGSVGSPAAAAATCGGTRPGTGAR